MASVLWPVTHDLVPDHDMSRSRIMMSSRLYCHLFSAMAYPIWPMTHWPIVCSAADWPISQDRIQRGCNHYIIDTRTIQRPMPTLFGSDNSKQRARPSTNEGVAPTSIHFLGDHCSLVSVREVIAVHAGNATDKQTVTSLPRATLHTIPPTPHRLSQTARVVALTRPRNALGTPTTSQSTAHQ